MKWILSMRQGLLGPPTPSTQARRSRTRSPFADVFPNTTTRSLPLKQETGTCPRCPGPDGCREDSDSKYYYTMLCSLYSTIGYAHKSTIQPPIRFLVKGSHPPPSQTPATGEFIRQSIVGIDRPAQSPRSGEHDLHVIAHPKTLPTRRTLPTSPRDQAFDTVETKGVSTES
jgi:hypothetical protein